MSASRAGVRSSIPCARPPSSVVPSGDPRVGERTGQDHSAHDREVERRRDAEEVAKVLQHPKQDRPQNHASNGLFAAPEREAAPHGDGDAVDMVEAFVRGGLDGPRVNSEEDGGEGCKFARDDVAAAVTRTVSMPAGSLWPTARRWRPKTVRWRR